MANRLVLVFGVAIGLLASTPLTAHHTGSTLLSETTVTLKGVVKTWLWSNPHCLLTLDVKGDDGQAVQWVLEAQSPNTIYPDGYRKIEARPFFLHVGRRKVNGHSMNGKEEPTVIYRCSDAFPALSNSGVGQADHSKDSRHPVA